MFLRLCVRKSRKKELIAVARNLLTVIGNVLHYKQMYQPHKQPLISKEKLKLAGENRTPRRYNWKENSINMTDWIYRGKVTKFFLFHKNTLFLQREIL